MFCQWRIQDFLEVGAPNLQGVPTYDFAKFSQKLHEIERIWTRRARPSHPFYIRHCLRLFLEMNMTLLWHKCFKSIWNFIFGKCTYLPSTNEVFSQACVSHSVHRGSLYYVTSCLAAWSDGPRGKSGSLFLAQCSFHHSFLTESPLGQRPNGQRTPRILL